MQRVLIIQTFVKKYREPFFNQLYAMAKANNIELHVLYSPPTDFHLEKKDEAILSNEFATRSAGRWLWGSKILYQPVFSKILNSDVIIIQQEVKHLSLYFLILLSKLRIKKFAFWGIGYPPSVSKSYLSNVLKKLTLNLSDFWFAYNHLSEKYLLSQGVNKSKIQVVLNSTDTKTLRNDIADIDQHEINALKIKLNISPKSTVLLFCGGLYAEKGITNLLQACVLASAKTDISLLIVGDGPLRDEVASYSSQYKWIHYMGTAFGRDKALYFKSSDLFVCGGLVGLQICDAFAAGLPLLATSMKGHGPEIDYLVHGENGFISDASPAALSDLIARICNDSVLLHKLKTKASEDGEKYTIETMTVNFLNGMKEFLKTK